jgi:hypothetical protein
MYPVQVQGSDEDTPYVLFFQTRPRAADVATSLGIAFGLQQADQITIRQGSALINASEGRRIDPKLGPLRYQLHNPVSLTFWNVEVSEPATFQFPSCCAICQVRGFLSNCIYFCPDQTLRFSCNSRLLDDAEPVTNVPRVPGMMIVIEVIQPGKFPIFFRYFSLETNISRRFCLYFNRRGPSTSPATQIAAYLPVAIFAIKYMDDNGEHFSESDLTAFAGKTIRFRIVKNRAVFVWHRRGALTREEQVICFRMDSPRIESAKELLTEAWNLDDGALLRFTFNR